MLETDRYLSFFFGGVEETDLQIIGVTGSISSDSREELFRNGGEGDFLRNKFSFSDWKRFLHCSMSMGVNTVSLFLVLLCVEGKRGTLQRGEETLMLFFSLCSRFFLRLMNGNMTKVTDSKLWLRLETITLLHCRAKLSYKLRNFNGKLSTERKCQGFIYREI